MAEQSGEARVHLWLRHEVKAFERRSPLTPANAAKLIAAGFEISVERSNMRIFADAEYEAVGCTLVETGTWPSAPKTCIILGLKELPETPAFPLVHRHILFAHCYKQQSGWREILNRFTAGGGTLYDLEFLVDDLGRRVAAFGMSAGFVGTALGLLIWAHQHQQKHQHPTNAVAFPPVHHFNSQADLVAHVQRQIRAANPEKPPSVIVIGAKGRCGSGASQMVRLVASDGPQVDLTEWDQAETAKGGPFPEILDHDVFVNAIYLSPGVKIPPFITHDLLAQGGPQRRLSVLSDVSCDCTNPNNPVPVYNEATSWDNAVLRIDVANGSPLSVTAIDNLPSVLPRESSADFSDALLPHLEAIGRGSPVWSRAEALFIEKAQQASQATAASL
eukprot:TRINITY_DN443_c0_g1_i4.p1 TRINITY_DN443_c0_g1~~TRINITY_DN443_c0_g1_i4.p1  ORF type:complete len:389 (-),score=69.66 TRINITY_DN443_c0_g1_i4:130-1296(-)